MKILHISWTGRHGGTENFTYHLAVAQQARGLSPVVCYLSSGDVFGEKLRLAGVPIFELGARRGPDPVAAAKLHALIKSQAIELIHNHDGPLGSFCALPHRHVPLILHVHQTHWHATPFQRWRRRFSYRLFAGRASFLMANSTHTAGVMAQSMKLPAAKIRVIPCALDFAPFAAARSKEDVRREWKIDPDTFVVGTVARLHEQKGVDIFLDIARRVHGALPQARFVIAGDGPLRAELERTAHEHGLSEVVLFLGARDDIPDVLSGVDVFAMTSRWEPFGITVLEAMASGTPVVAFAIDGVLDMLDESRALLVEKGHADAFADRILALQSGEEDPQALVKRSSEFVKRFDISTIERQVYDLYRAAKDGTA